MPRDVRGHLEGMEGCRAALQELGRTVTRNVGKRSLRAPAELLAARHRATLPVSSDPSDKTPGSLKDSPKVVPAKTEKGRARVAMVIDDVAAVPGEFGTSKMKPHLKVRTTTDAMRPALAQVMGTALKQEVDAAAQRAARKS
jgi:hypothetical protein